MENNKPYGEFEYHLMSEKLDKLCGKLSNKMIFEELSKDVTEYSRRNSVVLWNTRTSKEFISYISNRWEYSYCATLAVETVIKELVTSYPQTTFSHISNTLEKLTK